jgi:hypothetical protein
MSRAPPCERRARRASERKKMPGKRPFRGKSWVPVEPARIRAGGPVVDPRRAASPHRQPPDRDGPDGTTPTGAAPCKTTPGAPSTSEHYEGLRRLPSALECSSPSFARCAMAWACRSSSSRSATAEGEDRSMAQTDQAWDWGVELRDEERSELELLRSTVAQLRTQLDQAHESLRSCRQRLQEVSQAFRQLDEARPWRRRGVRTALRKRQLL